MNLIAITEFECRCLNASSVNLAIRNAFLEGIIGGSWSP